MKYPGQSVPCHHPPITFRSYLLGHQSTNIFDIWCAKLISFLIRTLESSYGVGSVNSWMPPRTSEVEVALAGARRSPRQGAAASLGSMISKRKHGRARLLQKYAKYRHQMRAARLGRTNYASHAIDKDRWTD